MLLTKQSALVTTDALNALPLPLSRGRFHQPVPHGVLVQGLVAAAAVHGYRVTRQQLAVSRTGYRLFGVMDVEPPADTMRPDNLGFAIGFRNSTNETLGIKLVAGVRVTICDNLAMDGELLALERRNTTGLDLAAALTNGFKRYLDQQYVLDSRIRALKATSLTTAQAKEHIFDVFARGVLPMRLFPRVARNYFAPNESMTDCQPSTLWGLHNATTRAIKQLSPARAFAAHVALGRLFGMSSRDVH